jgi:hypothetical protein
MNWTSEMATFQNKKGMAFGFEFRLMFHRTSEKKGILASSRQVKKQICTLSR